MAHLYVVEFQKRGLPQNTYYLDEDSRLRTTEDVDEIVCAELPPDPSDFAIGSEMNKQATFTKYCNEANEAWVMW